MRVEPTSKRTVAFIDGQNLFHAAKEAFGHIHPNYDVRALAHAVCRAKGWSFEQVRFYTGVPNVADNAFWHHYWSRRLVVMDKEGVIVFSRPLRYRNRVVRLPDGSEFSYLSGVEKGIDVRLALDVIRLAHRSEFDVALIFSQDQDLSEAAREVRAISIEQDRWIKVACAYPLSPTSPTKRGIEGCDWIPIDRATYDACLDRRDYRAKESSEGDNQP